MGSFEVTHQLRFQVNDASIVFVVGLLQFHQRTFHFLLSVQAVQRVHSLKIVISVIVDEGQCGCVLLSLQKQIQLGLERILISWIEQQDCYILLARRLQSRDQFAYSCRMSLQHC